MLQDVYGPALPTCAVQQVGSCLGYTGRDRSLPGEAVPDSGLPTLAVQQVDSYLGYTGHQISAVAAAARDPKPS
jgi:hypothetical protein